MREQATWIFTGHQGTPVQRPCGRCMLCQMKEQQWGQYSWHREVVRVVATSSHIRCCRPVVGLGVPGCEEESRRVLAFTKASLVPLEEFCRGKDKSREKGAWFPALLEEMIAKISSSELWDVSVKSVRTRGNLGVLWWRRSHSSDWTGLLNENSGCLFGVNDCTVLLHIPVPSQHP